MDEIKESLIESIRLQKDLEFLQDFETSFADSFVTRTEVLRLLGIVSQVLQQYVDKKLK